MSERVGQSICKECGNTVRPGKGTVLNFGAGGRVHTQECLQNAQKPIALRELATGDPIPLGAR